MINGRDDVADATRARVQDALAKLGYESPAQRRSKSAGPALVDLVFHRLHSSYSLEVMAGIVECAAEEGVEIVLSGCKPAKLRSVDHEQWSQRLAESGRKGLILVTSEVTAGQLQSFRRRNIPVVVIDPFSPPGSEYVSIGATNWAGGKAATGHLIALGHRKIAFLGGPEAVECSVARLHGYLAVLRANGLTADPDYVLPGRFNHRAVRSPPDVGGPAAPEMGWAALRTLLRLAKGETLESNHVELATRLVVRDSTAVPAG